jgi:hypothetical protein
VENVVSLIWSILGAVAWPLVHAFTLFMYFLAFITVYRAHLNGNLAKAARVTRWSCYSIVGAGWLIDVTLNMTLASLILWELPKQATFTQRCSSHLAEPGRRGNFCRWVCSQLDLFQDGGHCK